MEFRTLYANEIECRVGTCSAKGCSLLLYKDARVDMNLLDEIVGAENWQRKHDVVNGNLYCSVGIRTESDWVWKQDVGVESNTEKQKGEASDSFKRACFNWGIGRELYTAPFIWIAPPDVNVTEKNGKWTTYDKFYVDYIEYDSNRNIIGLRICAQKGGKVVYTFGDSRTNEAKDRAQALKKLNALCDKKKITPEQMCKANGKVWDANDLSLITQMIQALER